MEKLDNQDDASITEELVLSKFFENIDDMKNRKQSLKSLESLQALSNECWDLNFRRLLTKFDLRTVTKLSSLMEISTYTREVVERNLNSVLPYINKMIHMVTDKDAEDLSNDGEYFNAVSVNTVKACLHLLQFFPEKLQRRFVEEKSLKADVLSSVISCLLKILMEKGFSKDCSWLAGTAVGLLYNLEVNENTGENFLKLVNYLQLHPLEEKKSPCTINGLTVDIAQNSTSFFGQITVINGVLSVASERIMLQTIKGVSLLERLFDILIHTCLKIPDATAKYICFKTIFQWMSFLSSNRRLEIFMKSNGQRYCGGMFLNLDSTYTKIVLDIVRNHVEDLVDGVPQLTQKIFNKFLHLHQQEIELLNASTDVKNVYVSLAKMISSQAWFMKGRWMLTAELIPYLAIDELLQLKEHVGEDLMKCLNTCSLPAISNEVYQAYLKNLKKRVPNKQDQMKTWSLLFEDVFLSGICHESLILRQNLGQYWLPSTFNVIGHCFTHLEDKVSKFSLKQEDCLHGHILLIKAAWQAGLLKSNDLFERKSPIEQGLRSIDIDLRIETFNIVCTNTKKTEPLPSWLHKEILSYVKNNLNCDSAKFRQQMFSALKRLLLNIRDSSIATHRNSTKKQRSSDTSLQESLNDQINFIEKLFGISKLAFIPSASFQTKKTGLLIISLLTEVFVYVENIAERKRNSPHEIILPLLKYVKDVASQGDEYKWGFVKPIARDILSCLEDQHDEIRELAYVILCYQQEICGDSLLQDSEMCSGILNAALNLMNSPKYHETESGGSILHFIATRLSKNADLGVVSKHMFENVHKKVITSSPPCLGLLKILIIMGKESLEESRNDFLMASSKRPVFGISIAISQVLKSIRMNSISSSEFHEVIKMLLEFCCNITNLMTDLLAGQFTSSSSLEEGPENVSPSFADIDEAIDFTLKSCQSYKSLSKSLGHCHCQELLLSFCWLNLKVLSFIIAELGNLCRVFKKELLLTPSNLEVIHNYFVKTLINCQHKGVIESSLVALKKFSESIAAIPTIWKEVSSWCESVLKMSTTSFLHSSVTKRSAGIPMFIQAVLSAEPSSVHHQMLNETMEYLFTVASTTLPRGLEVTNDLVQFNAINILRAVFRDASLNNAVMKYVERGVLLTIEGFSSPSWSIRNASTQLLSTLVPRMLGQRLSQEESSQQSTTSVDVFFYHYPKLLPLFEDCLSKQADAINTSSIKILPDLIPILIFLSKLQSNDSEECISIFRRFYPRLQRLQNSNVYTIRDLVSRAIVSLTPPLLYEELIDRVKSVLWKRLSCNNEIHCLYLICIKLIECSHAQSFHLQRISKIFSTEENDNVSVDHITHSISTDILIKLSTVLKTKESLEALQLHINKGLLLMLNAKKDVVAGMPYVQRSLANGLILLLKNGIGRQLLEQLRYHSINLEACSDFTDTFFNLLPSSYPHLTVAETTLISQLVSHCITESISLKAALKFCLDSHTLANIDLTAWLLLFSKHRSLLTLILPCLSQFLVDFPNEQFNVDDAISITKRVYQFSQPDVDENKRIAASRSLSVLQVVLNKKDVVYETALNYLWSAVLNLLQDEDEDVRNEATSSVQFLISESGMYSLQPSITLKMFFCLHLQYPFCGRMFLEWILKELLKLEDKRCLDKLMLFEQESSNLFYEEFVVTDLMCKAILDSKSLDLEVVHSHLIQIWMQLEILEKRFEGREIKSINTIFQEKSIFNKLFKCLKLVNLIVVSTSDKEKLFLSIDVANLLEKVKAFVSVPSIKSAFKSISLAYLKIQDNPPDENCSSTT